MEEKKQFFCTNCGERMNSTAKFCQNCGTPANAGNQDEEEIERIDQNKVFQQPAEDTRNKRTTVYEGEIHKCPNCGEVLKAFTATCPSCGHELRGATATSAVRELSAKLEAIESERNTNLKGIFIKKLTKIDEKKISLIRNFSIPNTKEDLYEFLILSKSNIDIDLYENDSPMMRTANAHYALSDAWKAKFEQAYQKSKLVFEGDAKMADIQAMYDSVNKSIKKAKTKVWKILGIVYGILFVIIAIAIIFGVTHSSNSKKKEEARLEAIVEQIESALESDDYRLALMYADSLYYRNSDANLERDWEIKREYWIDKVIKEASEDGVTLEKPVEKNKENDTSTEENKINRENTEDSLSSGFNDAIDKSKEEIQKNIDKFYENLNSDGEASTTNE